jgi:hypothetical protein
VRRAHRKGARKAKRENENNAATQHHFSNDRFIPYRTGSRAHAMLQIYHNCDPIFPIVSDGEIEMRSKQWTQNFSSITVGGSATAFVP